jgi:hypothetical protein
MTHPKDAMIHIGDLWSPYKSTRAHNQGRKIGARRHREKVQGKVLRQGRTEAELQRWKTSSQGWDALGDFGEV